MLLKIIQLLPTVAFFITYKAAGDLILATAVILGGALLAAGAEYLVARTLSRLQIFTVAAVIIFGVPTVLLKDPEIIKWKVSAVCVLSAALIFVFQHLLHKNPFAYLLGKELPLPAAAWRQLGYVWMIFFLLDAGLNLVIAFALPAWCGISAQEAEDWWVDYKTVGNPVLNFIVILASLLWTLHRHPQALKSLLAASPDLPGAAPDKEK